MASTEVPVALYRLRSLGGGLFAEDPAEIIGIVNSAEVSTDLYILRGGGASPTVLSEAEIADLAPFSSASFIKQPMHSDIAFEAGTFTATTSPTRSYRAVTGTVQIDQRWGRAIWRPIATDPLYQVRALSVGNGVPDGHVFGYWRIPPNWEVPEPKPASGTWVNNEAPPQRDGWTTVVWADGSRTTDFYKMRPWYSNGVLSHFTCSSRVPCTFDLVGNASAGQSGNAWSGITVPAGVTPTTQGGRASSIPQIAMSIRRWEFIAAEAQTLTMFDHALDIAIPNEALKSGYIWPARSQDGDSGNYSGYVPTGSMLALPLSTSIASLGLATRAGAAAAKTLQVRGAYVAARSSYAQLGVEMPFSGDTVYGGLLTGFKADWQKITKKLVVVTGSTAANPGGTGDPLGVPGPEPIVTAITRGDQSTLNQIVCWGDSLTASSGSNWPSQLATLLGVPVSNQGSSGMGTSDIALRQGGLIPLVTVTGNSIPAVTPVPDGGVVVTAISPATGWRINGSGSFDRVGTLAGIPGTLRHNLVSNQFTFTRTTSAASATTIPAASEFIGNELLASHRRMISVFWTGRNNSFNPTPEQVTVNTQKMVDFLTPSPKEYVVLGVTNTGSEGIGTTFYPTIVSINQALAAAHPGRFIDIRRYLIDSGLAAAGITPTSADNTDIANDRIPISLRSDSTHLNAAGYTLVAQRVRTFIQAAGWV